MDPNWNRQARTQPTRGGYAGHRGSTRGHHFGNASNRGSHTANMPHNISTGTTLPSGSYAAANPARPGGTTTTPTGHRVTPVLHSGGHMRGGAIVGGRTRGGQGGHRGGASTGNRPWGQAGYHRPSQPSATSYPGQVARGAYHRGGMMRGGSSRGAFGSRGAHTTSSTSPRIYPIYARPVPVSLPSAKPGFLHKLRGKSSVKLKTDKHRGYELSAVVEIGSQSVEVLVDTGSRDLIVFGDHCKFTHSNGNDIRLMRSSDFYCPIPTAEGGSYARLPMAEQDRAFHSGLASGQPATDTVQMGNAPCIPDQFLLHISEASGFEVTGPEIMGVIGMSPFEGMSGAVDEPYWLRVGRCLNNTMFGLYLKRPSLHHEEEDKVEGRVECGQLTIGGLSDELIEGGAEALHWLPTRRHPSRSNAIEWFISLGSFDVEHGVPISVVADWTRGTHLAMLDSGSSHICGPKEYVRRMFSQVHGAEPVEMAGVSAKEAGGRTEERWTVPQPFRVAFTIGTRRFALEPNDVIYQRRLPDSTSKDGFYYTQIIGHDLPFWVLGLPFLQNVYSAYALKEGQWYVGLAPPRYKERDFGPPSPPAVGPKDIGFRFSSMLCL